MKIAFLSICCLLITSSVFSQEDTAAIKKEIKKEIAGLEEVIGKLKNSVLLLENSIRKSDTLINAVEQKQTEVRQERDTLEQEFRNLQMTSQELDGMIKDYLKIQADLKKDLGSGKGEEEETKKTKKELNDIGKTLREAKLRNDSTLADIKKMTSMIEKRKKQLERNETELKRIKTQRTDTQSELDKGNRLIAAIGKQINELKLLLDK